MNAGWWFDDDPDEDDRLLTDRDAETAWGVKASTIRSWRRRNKVHPDGIDSLGRAVYAHRTLLALAHRTQPSAPHTGRTCE